MKKSISEISFEEFDKWCNARACDGAWDLTAAIICIAAIREVLKVKPLFGRKKARERAWQSIKADYFNLDAEIEVE